MRHNTATVEDLIAALREARIDIASGPVVRRDGTSLFVHDPDGVRVELSIKRVRRRGSPAAA